MSTELKRIKIVITSLERQGCVVRKTGSGGWFVKFPNGQSTTIHYSQSDHRAEKNVRAYVIAANLEWPFDAVQRRKVS